MTGRMKQHYHFEERDGKLWLAETEYAPEFEAKSGALFGQGNGYLGVRGATALPALFGLRGTMVAGLYHRPFSGDVEELVNCPDIARVDLAYGNRKLTGDGKSLVFFHRSFCPQTGELISVQHFSPEEGIVFAVKERRFADFADPQRFMQQLEIAVLEGTPGELELTVSAHLDGSVTNSGVSHFSSMEGRVRDRRMMQLMCVLPGSTLPCDAAETAEERELVIRSVCRWSVQKSAACGGCGEEPGGVSGGGTGEANGGNSGGIRSVFSLQRRGISESRRYTLKRGEAVCLTRETRLEVHDCGEKHDACGEKSAEPAASYEEAFRAHTSVLQAHMRRAEIRIEGASLHERAAIALAQYHLTAMVPWGRTDVSVAAKGLFGEGYKGHVFWDMEIFILPWLLLFYPEQARNHLIYRYRQLPCARKKAKEYGYEGALYAWESTTDGEEQAPKFAAINIHTGKANPVWSAVKEHHISADIGFAVCRYLDYTGDADFMREYGLEMLLGISEFWCSRAGWDEERKAYVIRDVIGPDEYTEHIDNNAYTNYMAHAVMSGTLETAELLLPAAAKEEALSAGLADDLQKTLERIRFVRDRLYLPVPDKDGIIPQDDTFLAKPQLPQIERYRNAPVRQLVLQDYSRSQVVDMQVLKQADTVMLLALLPDLFAPETARKNIRFYADRTVHDSSLSYCMHARAFAQAGDISEAFEFFKKGLEIDLNDNPMESTDGIHAAAMGGILGSILFGFAGITARNGKIESHVRLPAHWRCITCGVLPAGGRPADGELKGGGPDGGNSACGNLAGQAGRKAVIFDLDGVICSTDRFHFKAWKKLTDRLGIAFDERINDRLRGISRMDSLEIILGDASGDYSPEEKEAMAAEKNGYYRAYLDTMTPDDLPAGVGETLRELRHRGYALAIGSSSRNTKYILKQLGLEGFFDAVADGLDITRSKPDPEVFLAAAKKLGIAPENCTVVEDSAAGIKAAKTGGMAAAALFGDARGCGLEDHDLRSFADLLTILC